MKGYHGIVMTNADWLIGEKIRDLWYSISDRNYIFVTYKESSHCNGNYVTREVFKNETYVSKVNMWNVDKVCTNYSLSRDNSGRRE